MLGLMYFIFRLLRVSPPWFYAKMEAEVALPVEGETAKDKCRGRDDLHSQRKHRCEHIAAAEKAVHLKQRVITLRM